MLEQLMGRLSAPSPSRARRIALLTHGDARAMLEKVDLVPVPRMQLRHI